MTLEERRELVDLVIRWREMATSHFYKKELAPAFQKAANELERFLDGVPCGEYDQPVTELEYLHKTAGQKLMCEPGHPSGAICMCFVECQHCIETRAARRRLRELQLS